jgi:hypothetical protein
MDEFRSQQPKFDSLQTMKIRYPTATHASTANRTKLRKSKDA